MIAYYLFNVYATYFQMITEKNHCLKNSERGIAAIEVSKKFL